MHADLVNRLKHILAEGSHNIGVIAQRFALIVFAVPGFIVEQKTVQAAVRTESVAREYDFLFDHVSHHGLGPMHQRGKEKLERVFPQAESLFVLDHFHIVRDAVEIFHHRHGFAHAQEFGVGCGFTQTQQRPGVIRFHVVGYDVIQVLQPDQTL